MRRVLFYIGISLLLLGAIGFWYWQKNSYSKDNLRLEILGPSEVDIAQEVEYTVKYKNNGNIRLEEPRLIFEFPDHTLVTDGPNTRQEVGSDKLGDIYPGEEKTFTFRCRLFGKEGDIKTAKASLNYRPKNLKPRYESSTTINTIIKPAPLTFEFDLPSKVETGRNFRFSINYFSSLNYPLSNLMTRVEYPSDFEFVESTPASLGKTEWNLPILNKAEGGRIEIRGKLTGQVRQQEIFSASLGIWLQDEFIPLKEISRGVEISKPSLYVFQQINGRDNYIASPGDILHYEVFFRNIGDSAFSDLFLVAKLSGAPFNFDSVKTDVGDFNRDDNSIVWDWRQVPELKFLAPGQEGKIEFWVNLKDDWQTGAGQVKNFSVKNNVQLSQIKEEFETKVNSKLVISQKGYFQDEVFGNNGSVPPRVGQPTTYTIVWVVKNYYNDLRNVKVKTTLPANVSLTGKFFPESESSKFAFDQNSREIVWTVSDGSGLPAGTGVFGQAPTIAFQVSLNPASDQRGKTAQIIGSARITGDDQWTEAVVEKTAQAVDTGLPDDPSVFGQQGIVQ